MTYTDFRITKETADYLFAEVTAHTPGLFRTHTKRVTFFKRKDSDKWRVYPCGGEDWRKWVQGLYEAHLAGKELEKAA